MSFDFAPTLSDGVLALSPLGEADREALSLAASDPKIWAGHPAKDRWQPEVFNGYFDFLLSKGGTLVARDVATGEVVGCSRFYPCPDAPEDIGIGFTFLVRKHWGGAMNWRMKSLMLAHAFQFVENVWFHIAVDNIRSQKATAKLGGTLMPQEAVNLAGSKDQWVRYRLSQGDWQRAAG